MAAHCHKMVAAVAKEAAGNLFDVVMGDNAVFEEWKRQNPGATQKQLENRFVKKNWGRCLEFARATLATMLSSSTISEEVKDEIADALVKDNQLIRGRRQSYQRFLQ